MIHLGIDLGTTFSLASFVNPHGIPALFPDYHDASEFRTPSVVHIGPDGCLVGAPLEELLEDVPDLPLVRFVKLKMGTDERVLTDHEGRRWPPEAISALILKKILRDVEAFAHQDIGAVVIAVPANFDDAQRRATRVAAALAGLRKVHLVEEPVAAATFYGMSEAPGEQTLFVYDLGGGTFDATVLQNSPEGLFVLATEGCNTLGGKNVDEKIMEMVAQEYRRQHGVDPRTDPESETLLRRFATSTKLKLAKPGREQVRKTLLLVGKPLDFLITRTQFEDLIEDLVEETVKASEKCLGSAGLSWHMIDKVLLTGGSSLLPLVTRKLQIASGKSGADMVTRQPHQAVVYGAAMVAEQRGREAEGDEMAGRLQPCSAYGLGIRIRDKQTGKPAVRTLVKRFTPLPTSQSATFYTTRPDQARMAIEALQFKDDEQDVRSLGYFAFGPITRPRKNYPVEITLGYDAEGIVTVTARDPDTGEKIEQVLDQAADGEGVARFSEEREWIRALNINQ